MSSTNEYNLLFKELASKVGDEKLKRLILLERATNQRYYAKKIEAVTNMMVKEAAGYEK